MTRQQYQRYLQLSHSRKRGFITLAKRQGMDSKDLYWLELGYAVHDNKFRHQLFETIYERGAKL